MPIPAAVADLPVVSVLGALGEALNTRTSAVLVASPGAGKTTVVPLWLLDQPWVAGRRIVMLEPRRLATRAAARRMAALLGESVGQTVGYQTRDERRIGPDTRIEVLTEGVLTRRLQHDPDLPGVAVVIFDEVHERNLPTDVGLALALDARTHLRPDLRLVAMSATPDAVRLAEVLAMGDEASDGPAPIVASEGREYPVEIRSLPFTSTPKGPRIEQAVAEAVLTALRDELGDVLVFLPGIGEIRRVETALRDRVRTDVDIYALAGALAQADQDQALAPSPAGRRRVVLSTDIAESSLTVAGIRVVVDAGLARVPRFDPRTGMTRLTTVATSRASADQRAGRAGRTEPGVCYRLWSKLEQSTRLAHLPAEITQVDLAGLTLELAAWQASVASLAFIDPPPAKAMNTARALLVELGALDTEGALTPTGRAMLDLPVHPRLARMIVDADDQALACVLAALVDERDVLRGRPDTLPADVELRVRLVCGDTSDERADRRAVAQLRERCADLARRARVALDFDRVDPTHCGAALALAFPDRVAVRRSQPGQFQMRTGGGAWVAKDDPLAHEPFVVAVDLDGNRTNARVRLGAGLDADTLAHALRNEVEHRANLLWDKQRNDLVLREEVRLGNMTLSDRTRTPDVGPLTVAALIDRIRVTRLAALPVGGAATVRTRVAFLRRLFPDDGWPDWSDGVLVATLDDWLAPYLQHATGRADLERLDVSMLLANQLDWDRQMQLADLAPVAFTTPSGRQVSIDYTGDQPRASVRVQDLFGVTTHPSIANGRAPITLELLSPADRPIQITADLPSFWAGSWADVRKDMAGRYPKHQWPTDPATAAPKRMKDR